jgi:hypothetical protein
MSSARKYLVGGSYKHGKRLVPVDVAGPLNECSAPVNNVVIHNKQSLSKHSLRRKDVRYTVDRDDGQLVIVLRGHTALEDRSAGSVNIFSFECLYVRARDAYVKSSPLSSIAATMRSFTAPLHKL